jgi:hypothetical protein
MAGQIAAEIHTTYREHDRNFSSQSLQQKTENDCSSLFSWKNKYSTEATNRLAKAEIPCVKWNAKIITVTHWNWQGLREPHEYLTCNLKSPRSIAPAISIIKIAFPKIHSILLIFLKRLLKGHVQRRFEFKATAPHYVNMFIVKRIFIKLKKTRYILTEIWRILTMVYNAQHHWDSRLFPSSGILNIRKHKDSETGSVSVLRWGKGDTYNDGSLRKR